MMTKKKPSKEELDKIAFEIVEPLNEELLGAQEGDAADWLSETKHEYIAEAIKKLNIPSTWDALIDEVRDELNDRLDLYLSRYEVNPFVKAKKKRKALPRVLITVSGGMIQDVSTDVDVEVLVYDWDNIKDDKECGATEPAATIGKRAWMKLKKEQDDEIEREHMKLEEAPANG